MHFLSHLMFLDPSVNYGPVLPVDYDSLLVVASYWMGALGSYAALLIGEHLRAASDDKRSGIWLLAGAIAMGLGVWSMHFLAMLAARLPIPVTYDVTVTGMSMLPAAIAGAVCLSVLRRNDVSAGKIILAGITMGAGIGVMHYVGMAAMRLNADMLYDLGRFLLSVVVAAVLATASLYMLVATRKLRRPSKSISLLASALIMGSAITAMHYTGMWAVYFFPADSATSVGAMSTNGLALAVGMVATAIIGLIIAASAVERHLDDVRTKADVNLSRLMATVDNIPEGFILFDESRRAVVWNQVFEEMLPESRGLLKAGTTYDEMFQRQSLGKERQLSDGRWVKVTESATESGKRAVLWSDITELKRAEEAVRRSEARLKHAQRIAKIGDWEWDIVNDEMRWSDELYRVLGETPETFGPTRENHKRKIHPDDRELAAAAEARALAGQELYAAEYRIVLSDGTQRTIQSQGEVTVDAEGRAIRMAGTVQDITERKSIDEALRKSEQKYRTIIDTAQEGIWLLDTEAVITYVNPRMAEILGYAPDEIVGRAISDFMHEHVPGQTARNMERCRSGTTDQSDFRLRHKAGLDVWVSIAATPMTDETGKFAGTLGMVADTTERRQLEEQLRQLQKMEAVGQLTGGIAHDFNNLLTVVVGNLQLVEESCENDAALLAQTRAALDAALRGAELTRRLLAFSRRQLLAPKVIDINDLVANLEPLLHRTLGEYISIEKKLHGDLWQTEIDPSQLESAVVNLAVNARDAMPNGGKLTIETGNVSLDEGYAGSHADVSPGEYVLLVVSDSGTGIPKEALGRVFDPFFTTKEIGKGTGLGLSMVYGFVKQSKGNIKIYSEEGHGTTVKLYLPRTRSDTDSMSASSTRRPQILGGSETILLVEDDAGVRQIGVALLTGLGYRVLESGSGPEALALLNQHHDVDLLFTDMVMPGGMTGAELAVRARQRNRKLKVLYTSGYTDTVNLDSGLLQNGDQMLNKPYQKRELAETVRGVLDETIAA
jgi:PAS domain S-box-containing protein